MLKGRKVEGLRQPACAGVAKVEEVEGGRGAVAEFVLATLAVLAVLLLPLAIALFCGGCASESAKVVEGTDLSVGFSLPMAEGEGNFTLFNWLSGFKTTTSESSRVKLRYTCAETNDYFGVVATRSWKTVDAEIEPVVDEAEEGNVKEGDDHPSESPGGSSAE